MCSSDLNRDTGLSTDFGSWGVPNIADAFQKVMSGKKVDAPYLLKDMAADAIGLLDALGLDHAPTQAAARAVAAAWLMGEGPEREALLAEARALRREVDPAALPILLPALSLGGMSAWRKPLAYWWAARVGRY